MERERLEQGESWRRGGSDRFESKSKLENILPNFISIGFYNTTDRKKNPILRWRIPFSKRRPQRRRRRWPEKRTRAKTPPSVRRSDSRRIKTGSPLDLVPFFEEIARKASEIERMSATVMNGEAAVGEEKMEVVEAAACECCGLTEECTPGYIARVRERYAGRWVCGLCGEAVEDEIGRSGRRISTEEAMTRQVSFCRNFRAAAASPVDPAEHFIAAVRQLLRRSLDAPRVVRSTPNSPRRKGGAVVAAAAASARSPLVRTGSCFSTLAG